MASCSILLSLSQGNTTGNFKRCKRTVSLDYVHEAAVGALILENMIIDTLLARIEFRMIGAIIDSQRGEDKLSRTMRMPLITSIVLMTGCILKDNKSFCS